MPFPSVSAPRGSSAPDLSGVYRKLLTIPCTIAATAITDGTERFISLGGGTPTALVTGAVTALAYLSIKGADYAVAGKTTKLRLSADLETNDTQIGTTLAFNLKRQTGLTGTTSLTHALDAAAATVTASNPAANGHAARLEQEIDIPADGLYVFTVTPGAAFATGSGLWGSIGIHVRNV